MSKLGNFSIFVLVTTLSITSIILFIPLIIHSLSLVLAAAAHLDIAPIKNGRIMVLYDATLIDGTGAKPRPHTVIILNEGKISSIVEKNQYQISVNDNRQIINLSGRYIIPGLFDMHAHVASVKASSYNQTASINMLRELLQWGITTIRNPGGPTEEAVMLKKMVNSGQLLGPHVFTAGNLINSMPPTGFVETMVQNASDVIREVRDQANKGVDYVKLYVNLTPDLVRAAIQEAHEQKIKVIGHLFATGWTEAANLGIDALTHGVPESPSLLSNDEARIFFNEGGGPFTHSLWLSVVDLNSNEIKEMIQKLVEKNVGVDPTLVIFEAILDGGDMSNNKSAYIWSKLLKLTKMMYDAGVLITSGSDIPNFSLKSGTSLHRELGLLVEAGIPPLEVIKIATRNSASSLGILNEVGTIEVGKHADLVILKNNPITNMNNTRSIEMVIQNGSLVNRSLVGNDLTDYNRS